MNEKKDRKEPGQQCERNINDQNTLNELIEQSKMLRNSISDTLIYLSMIKKDHSYAG